MSTVGFSTRDLSKLPTAHYQVVYADPPWAYYGDPNKPQAAGKHYTCMEREALIMLDVPRIVQKKAVCLMWATGPKLHEAVALLGDWRFFYRGVFQVWIKTNKEGKPIGAQGVRPSFTKQLDEFLLVGSTDKKGRTLPLLTESMPQNVLTQRPAALDGRPTHSAKPAVFRSNIVKVFGNVNRVELFCRGAAPPGWDAWGNEVAVSP